MRLIDADKLLETLQDLEPHCDNKKYENGVLKMLRCYMPQIINDEPTAYSVDKVVEELEIRVNEANNNCLCEMHENGHTLDFENENGRIKGLKEASEIVKQGGVSDDVYEKG